MAGRVVSKATHGVGLRIEILRPIAEVGALSVAVIPERGACGGHVGLNRRLVGGRGLSEGRAGDQRNQRESSDKRFHDASPSYGRLSVGSCNRGRSTARAFAVTEEVGITVPG